MFKVARGIFTLLIIAVMLSVPAITSPVSAATGNNFSAHTVSTATDGAVSVHAADVDGDGDIDLMSASQFDDKIAWYENINGDGSAWVADNISTTADGAWSVHAADVDGDGDIDLMSASYDDNKIAWYENINGDGSAWVADNITTSATFVNSVYAADVDGDGDMDVIYASELGSKVGWYENTAGDGSAWALVVDKDVTNPRSVYAADVDGDGDIDLMSTFSNNSIVWFENSNGDGTVFSQQWVNISLNYSTSVHAADVDGDGDIDLMSASSGDDKIAWYENTAGDGSAWTPHDVSTTADGTWSVHAADVDGDGDIDLMSASEGDDKIAWYENTAGDGSAWTAHNVSTAADGAWSVYAADVDGDGDIDLMSALRNDDKIAWYENLTIHRSALFPQQSVVSTAADTAWSVYAADVDSDGDLDLMSASSSDNKIAWYENTAGDGSAWTTHNVTTAASGAISVYATDVDGDGDIDLTAALWIPSKVVWYENTAGDGSAWSVAHEVSASATGVWSVYAADVDGDGDVDLMAALAGVNKITWYENTAGDGSAWTAHDVSTVAFDARSVYAADVDSDGDLDLMSASAGDDKVTWYENDGSQNFTAHDVSTVAFDARSVYAADVDSDGDIDLMSASEIDKIAWYENTTGDGSAWTEHAVYLAALNPSSVYAADLDGDGDIDLMSASKDDDKIAWYENTVGDGSAWTTHIATTSADNALSVYAADVDGDGDVDLMSASSYDDKIAWYENRGGQFALATTDTAPANLDQGQTDDLLKVAATHKGRTGDADMELVTLDLLFEESAGDPLTTAEANAIIENFFIYLDDGSGAFEAGSDTLVTTVADLSLTAGKQTVTLTDGDANVQVAYGTPRTYFVVAELTADAGSQTPNQFRITHLTASSSTAEDRDYDLPLTLEYVADASSGVLTVNPPPPPEINLKKGATDIADGGAYNYGTLLVNSNTDVIFTIENTGTADLTLTTPLAIAGADAVHFSIQQQPVSPVTPGNTTTFTVRFSPTTPGVKTATIAIANNDGDENPYDFTITGTCIDPSSISPVDTNIHSHADILGSSHPLTTDITGKVIETVTATSPDGSLTLTIPEGTVMKRENGWPLHGITASVLDPPPPAPENKYIIGLAYDFEPDGATFSPPLTLTFTYDPATLPEGVAETELVLAYYDENTGEWVELVCTVDTVNHTITASIPHFTTFAIIGEVKVLPAAFSLSELTVSPSEVEPGEAITVVVTVTNTGGTEGDYSLILEVNGEYEESAAVTIAAGKTASVSFTLSKEQPGTYTLSVNGITASFEVTAPTPALDPEPTPTPTPAAVTPTPIAPAPTTAAPTTPAPAPPAPTLTPPELESTTNWLLIGVIVAAAIILIVFLIFKFVTRRD